MYKLDQSKIPQMMSDQGDPLLGALGSMVGSAIGGSMGGPAGAALGGSIGGQLGGTGTLDLEKTAIDSTKGAAGNALMGGMGSAIDSLKPAMAATATPLMEQGVDPLIANKIAQEKVNKGFLGYFEDGGEVKTCPPGFILDSTTNTCVPFGSISNGGDSEGPKGTPMDPDKLFEMGHGLTKYSQAGGPLSFLIPGAGVAGVVGGMMQDSAINSISKQFDNLPVTRGSDSSSSSGGWGYSSDGGGAPNAAGDGNDWENFSTGGYVGPLGRSK